MTDDTKKELMKVAAELQVKLGRRVDLNEAVLYLVSMRRKKDPALLEEACKPREGAREAVAELLKERGLDEEQTERKIRHRY